MKKTVKFKIFLILKIYITLCCFSVLVSAEERPNGKKTQKEFANKLCRVLALEVPDEDFISQLEKRGISPETGWQPGKPIDTAEMATLLAKALQVEKFYEEQPTSRIDITHRNKAIITNLFGKAKVMIGSNGDWISAEPGMKLTQDDSIKTETDSWVELQIGLASAIKIKENTQITLRNLSTSLDGDENIILYMNIGELLIDARGISDKSDFRIYTPTSIAAVRGTIYNIKVVKK